MTNDPTDPVLNAVGSGHFLDRMLQIQTPTLAPNAMEMKAVIPGNQGYLSLQGDSSLAPSSREKRWGGCLHRFCLSL